MGVRNDEKNQKRSETYQRPVDKSKTLFYQNRCRRQHGRGHVKGVHIRFDWRMLGFIIAFDWRRDGHNRFGIYRIDNCACVGGGIIVRYGGINDAGVRNYGR